MAGLKIVSWNANGLISRKLELDYFLHSESVDICLVSETHCTEKFSVGHTPTYRVYHTFHPSGTARGGTAIYVKKSLDHAPSHWHADNNIQLTSITLSPQHQSVHIASCYCSPSARLDTLDFELILSYLGQRYIIGGDFNAKNPVWGSLTTSSRGQVLYRVMQQYGALGLRTPEPTYWPSDMAKNPDVIDFFIIRNISPHSSQVSTITELSSDHLPIMLETGITPALRKPQIPLTTKLTDWEKYRAVLEDKINLHQRIKTTAELDRATAEFTSLLQEAASQATPTAEPTPSNLPHYPSNIHHLVTNRRRARREWQQTRSPAARKAYNRINNFLHKQLRKHRNECLSHFLTNLSPSADKEYSLWRATKKFRNAPSPVTQPILNNGSWCTQSSKVVELFAAHLQKAFSPNDIDSDADLTSNRIKKTPLQPVTPHELARQLDRINLRKSPGSDKVTGRMLAELPRKAILLFTYICNAAFRLCHVPAPWKVAKVIMLLKPGKPAELVSSYRPISLLPIPGKIFEKLLHTRLQTLLQDKDPLPEHQFGFRSKHSTIDQVQRLTTEITSAFENKMYCTAAFLDVAAAFDKVWHDGLIAKLSMLLPTNVCCLLRSYITARSFYVTRDGTDSTLHTIAAGVPQGSVLGPLLYTLFTRDIPSPPSSVLLATFADDTALLATSPSYPEAITNANTALAAFSAWAKRWKIAVNSTKSVHVDFALRHHGYEPLYLDGTPIPHSTSARYLGIHLDKRLTYSDHLNTKKTELKLRLRRMTWLLSPKSAISQHNKRLLYLTTLRPVWAYGIQLWGCASRSQRKKIQRFQNNVVKLISGAPWFVHRDLLHADLQIPMVDAVVTQYAQRHEARLHRHPNTLALQLLDTTTTTRRLKRSHVSDLVSLHPP